MAKRHFSPHPAEASFGERSRGRAAERKQGSEPPQRRRRPRSGLPESAPGRRRVDLRRGVSGHPLRRRGRRPGPVPDGLRLGSSGRERRGERATGGNKLRASPAAVRDLEAGIVDERLISTLQTVSEEHQVCVTAFKEGHYFLPGVPDTTVIPDGYGEAGALFSKYTRSGGEVPRSVGRGGSHGRTVYDVEVRVLGYFSSLVRFVQPGQILEGLIQCTA